MNEATILKELFVGVVLYLGFVCIPAFIIYALIEEYLRRRRGNERYCKR